MNKWIFISPHLDDVTLSCGGLVWSLAQAGESVEVWTLVAGLPASNDFSPFAEKLHRDWGAPGAEIFQIRREEDLASCAVMGALAHHFDWLDAIYRPDPAEDGLLVNDVYELFNKAPEEAFIDELAVFLSKEIPKNCHVVSPMGLGNHVDHRAVVQACEQTNRVDYYYADYPYILNHYDDPLFDQSKWETVVHHLGEAALAAWQSAVLCYTSQLSSFWRDNEETRLALRNYRAGGGGRLWVKKS